MKSPVLVCLFGLSLALGPAALPAASSPANRELSVVVVESLHEEGVFDRIDIAFTKVLEQRHWPVTVKVERFAANLPSHGTEMRVFFKGIREEGAGDLTFRAWMTLADQGKSWDFGIVSFRYYPRPGQRTDDVLDQVFQGAANKVADKIEPLLFPKPPAPKP